MPKDPACQSKFRMKDSYLLGPTCHSERSEESRITVARCFAPLRMTTNGYEDSFPACSAQGQTRCGEILAFSISRFMCYTMGVRLYRAFE